MKRILLLVTALILYGSFYPWQFHTRLFPVSPLWILLHSWPRPFTRGDAIDAAVNIPLYMPFGMFCFLSMNEAWPRASRMLAAVSAGILLSTSVELAQLFDTGRVTSIFDILCNTIGTAIGVTLASRFPAAISDTVTGVESVGAFRPSAAMVLLYLWSGFELFPFMPLLHPSVFVSKLVAFAHPANWPIRDAFENLGMWLALGFLVEAIAGRTRTARVLALMLLAIPLKLVIGNRTMTGYEIAGALSGIVLWFVFSRFPKPSVARTGPARPSKLSETREGSAEPGSVVRASFSKAPGLIALGAVIAAGLIPFDFSVVPQRFTWIPFLPSLSAPWESAFLILLQKSFLYGATVWLLHQGGWSWFAGSLTVATALAAVEVVQIHLPGRTPELTDPLVAILLGFAFMLLDRHQARHQPARLSAL